MKNFQLEENINKFKWIGKILDLNKMELSHTQILEQKESFYTVNINFPETLNVLPNFIKGKFKTFLLNQNLFYFNKKINSDEKFLSSLKDIIHGASLKLNVYLTNLQYLVSYNKLEKNQRSKMLRKVSYRLNETINDFAKLVTDMSHGLDSGNIQKKLNEYFLCFFKSKRDN